MLFFKSYFKLKMKLFFMNQHTLINDAVFLGLSLIDNIYWLEFYRSNSNKSLKYIPLEPLDRCLSIYIEFLTNTQQNVSIYTAYLLSVKTYVFRKVHSENIYIDTSVLRENMRNICQFLNLFYLSQSMCHCEKLLETNSSAYNKKVDLFDSQMEDSSTNLPETIEAFLNTKQNTNTDKNKFRKNESGINCQKELETYYHENLYNTDIISKIFHHFIDDHCLTLKTRKFSFCIIKIMIKVLTNFPEIASDLSIVLLHFFLCNEIYSISDFQQSKINSNSNKYMFTKEYDNMAVNFVVSKVSSSILHLQNPPEKMNAQFTELFIHWVKTSKEKLDKLCYF